MVFCLLYFAVFFYSVYRMVMVDRAVETVRYRRMKIFLIVFGSIHVLIGLVLAQLMKF